ncbi:MAG: tRNA (adenosine(37)-N6)-dimethylallyltransferase MiaA [Elusimicrobiota bacterium]|jgi:tRNA dimethylallyltransferase|nr:tRNA (adenosine(37)-N6)-dimethylallyltransferase MiaA [Elusimicrobiota bacterium]
MENIVIFSGPTAVGKTQKALEFCKQNGGEIISCDSRQIYKYLDIGTNKDGYINSDGFRTTGDVRIHLTDIIEPNQIFNASDFAKAADDVIKKIVKKNKTPVITCGTGLYLKALLYGLDEMPQANIFLREKLQQKTQKEIYEQLLELDPISAEKNQKNPQRLIRALEVSILSGKKMSDFFKPKKVHYNFKHYILQKDRKVLYETINKRCENMLENGMIEETEKVLSMGFGKTSPALSGIGYRDIIAYLEGKIDKKTLFENFSKDTRHYAKRQITWFKFQVMQIA